MRCLVHLFCCILSCNLPDMNKLQPILLGLQATESELPQLLPQLMQTPFFNQTLDPVMGWNLDCASHGTTDVLGRAHLRIGLPVDTAIYHLLRSHCAKGAKQAEGIIKTALASSPALLSPIQTSPPLPPIIFPYLSRPSPSLQRTPSPRMLSNGFHGSNSPSGNTEDSSSTAVGETMQTNGFHPSTVGNTVSGSSIASSFRTSTSSLSSTCSSLNGIVENETLEGSGSSAHLSPLSASHGQRYRKITRCHLTQSSSSDLSGDEWERKISRGNPSPDNIWTTRIVDDQTIVGMYGKSSYPLLLWSPTLQVEFEITSSVDCGDNAVIRVDPGQPTVSMRVANNSEHHIGFSIRAYRQSTKLTPHIVYPTQGLATMEPCQCWEESAEFLVQYKKDYFVIDLFVCSLEGQHPSWNVVRKYVRMKAPKK